jgi:hypothetical protein
VTPIETLMESRQSQSSFQLFQIEPGGASGISEGLLVLNPPYKVGATSWLGISHPKEQVGHFVMVIFSFDWIQCHFL